MSAWASIAWAANTEPDLAGYRVYYGTTSNPASTYVDVPAPRTNEVISGLTNYTQYYFRVTAYDTSNNESSFSAQVVKHTGDNSQVTTFI